MSKRKDGASGQPSWRYRGIRRPGYTQVPDDYIDEVMAHLTGAEFKVLMYLSRRTLGFKRASDQISLNQLCSGIKKRDGTQLDHGTGLSRQAVLDALRRLGELGIVAEQQTIRDDGAYEAKTYTLLFDDPDPLDDTEIGTGANGATSISTTTTLQSTRRTRGSKNLTAPSTETTPLSINQTPSSRKQSGPSSQATAPSNGATGAYLAAGPDGGHFLDPQDTVEKTVKQETVDSKISKAPHEGNAVAQTSPERDRLYNTHILNLVDDLSAQFHDEEALGSNRTRIMRIWNRSEFDEATFVDIMYEARRRTLRAANIQHHSTGGDTLSPNRMPYYFTVLQDLIDREVDGLPDGPS